VISTGEYFLRRKEADLTYHFGADGKLIEISDPNGNTLSLAYTEGFLTEVSSNFGKTISIEYSGGRISSVTDPEGQSVGYQYENGDLVLVSYPDTQSIGYAYSSHGLSEKRDTSGSLIGHWDYDTDGRVSTHYRYLEGGVPQERVDFARNLFSTPQTTTLTRSTGTSTYASGIIDGVRMIGAVEGCATCGGGAHKSFSYDNRLNLTDVTLTSEGQEYTTHYTYDSPVNPWDQVGEIIEMRRAVGWPDEQVTTYTYTHRADDPFLLTQSTVTTKSVANPSQNKVVTTAYDEYGNVQSRIEEGYVLVDGIPSFASHETQYQYNSFGQITRIDGPRTDVSDITTFEYHENTPAQSNNRGRLKAVVNALGQRTGFSEYDGNGNPGAVTDRNGVISRYTYDERNRLVTVTNEATGALTQYSHDSHGNVSSVILPEGNRLDFTFTPSDRLKEVRDDLGNRLSHSFDVEGNQVGEDLYDPQGALRKSLDFTYDSYNRIERITTPGGDYTQYTYDERGNPTEVRDPGNRVTSLDYDALRRLKTITRPLATITHQAFDTQDNLAAIIDPKGNSTQYPADDFGKRSVTVSPDTGTTRYLYDEAGNLIRQVDAKETVINYTYDVLNRLTAVQFPSDPTRNIAYTYDSPSVTHGTGRLTGRTDPSGTYAFHYDAHGNLSKEEKTISGILYTTRYTFDRNDTLTSITYPSGRVVTYTLNEAGRISRVDTTLVGSPKTIASSISYLPFGGITGLTYGNGLSLVQGHDNQYRTSSITVSGVLDLTYQYFPDGSVRSAVDALGAGGTVLKRPGTYTYDSGSNRLSHFEGTAAIDFGSDANGNITSENTRAFVYDPSNQLIRILDDGTPIAEYTYNGAGERIKKAAQARTTIYHYDLQGHLIAETDAAGQPLAEYLYLGDRLVAMIRPGESVYYYHNDHLGAPLALTDDSGSIAWKARYSPFGQALISVETVENPFRLPGQYFDAETGYHYNYHRYYDPKTGRYITPDPIGLAGGINPYVYVLNDPVNLVDPLGLYDMLDFGGDALSFTAGLGNAVALGGSTWIANQFLNSDDAAVLGRTKRCSGAFKAGEWASLGLGAGRLAYAGIAKAGSMSYAALGATMENAAAASTFRNGLKQAFRLNPWSQFRVYPFERMVEKYGTAEAIIEAAGRTNTGINMVGAAAAAGGAATLATTDDCGCN
jgi:RHS repeat-associated protein